MSSVAAVGRGIFSNLKGRFDQGVRTSGELVQLAWSSVSLGLGGILARRFSWSEFVGLLDRSIDLNDILAARDPHLRELFDAYGSAVGSLGSIVHGNELHFNVYMAEQKICSYGNTRRSPTDATRHPMQTGGHCSAALDFLQRGAVHAPAPLW